jgi:hypothetical protein
MCVRFWDAMPPRTSAHLLLQSLQAADLGIIHRFRSDFLQLGLLVHNRILLNLLNVVTVLIRGCSRCSHTMCCNECHIIDSHTCRVGLACLAHVWICTSLLLSNMPAKCGTFVRPSSSTTIVAALVLRTLVATLRACSDTNDVLELCRVELSCKLDQQCLQGAAFQGALFLQTPLPQACTTIAPRVGKI